MNGCKRRAHSSKLNALLGAFLFGYKAILLAAYFPEYDNYNLDHKYLKLCTEWECVEKEKSQINEGNTYSPISLENGKSIDKEKWKNYVQGRERQKNNLF